MSVPTPHDYQLPAALRTEQEVLWTFARVAEQRDLKALLLLQETVYQLAEKVKQARGLTAAETDFVKACFDNPWWGGSTFGLNQSLSWSGRPETLRVQDAQPKPGNGDDEKQMAVVAMLRHFFEGQGQLYAADLRCFQTSVIVAEVIAAFKKIIYEHRVHKKPTTRLSTEDSSFLNSKFGMDVESSRRSLNTRGYIFSDGTMMLEQKCTGLNNFKNRFVMEALTTQMGQMCNTQWRIKGHFTFPNFDENSVDYELPLVKDLALKIPAGLGGYLVARGLANPFDYFTSWAETYHL